MLYSLLFNGPKRLECDIACFGPSLSIQLLVSYQLIAASPFGLACDYTPSIPTKVVLSKYYSFRLNSVRVFTRIGPSLLSAFLRSLFSHHLTSHTDGDSLFCTNYIPRVGLATSSLRCFMGGNCYNSQRPFSIVISHGA